MLRHHPLIIHRTLYCPPAPSHQHINTLPSVGLKSKMKVFESRSGFTLPSPSDPALNSAFQDVAIWVHDTSVDDLVFDIDLHSAWRKHLYRALARERHARCSLGDSSARRLLGVEAISLCCRLGRCEWKELVVLVDFAFGVFFSRIEAQSELMVGWYPGESATKVN